MLEPTQRQHLLQTLCPPEGYELAFAIGTTYSLDLLALLSVPLAFAQFDWEDDAGRPSADPLALLEALRRYADRLHIFCQVGSIAVPTKAQLLFGYLETPCSGSGHWVGSFIPRCGFYVLLRQISRCCIACYASVAISPLIIRGILS